MMHSVCVHYIMTCFVSRVLHFYQVMDSYSALLQVTNLFYIIKSLNTVRSCYVFVFFSLQLLTEASANLVFYPNCEN